MSEIFDQFYGKDKKTIRGFKEFIGNKMVSKTDFKFDDQDRILGYNVPDGSRLDFEYNDGYTTSKVTNNGELLELSNYKEDGSILETLKIVDEENVMYYYKAEENDILYVINSNGDITWGFDNGSIKAVYTSGVLEVSYKEDTENGSVEHNRKYFIILPYKNKLYNYLYGIFKELNPFQDYKSYFTGNLLNKGYITEE